MPLCGARVSGAGLLLLDVLVPADRDTDKVIDVFVRKLGAKSVKQNQVLRG